MQKLFFIILFLFAGFSSSAQTKAEWFEFGESAFKNKDYASALYYYEKYLGKSAAGSGENLFPYELKPWYKKEKADSVQSQDTTIKTSEADLREQYVTHQVAECYRQLYSYKQAEEWYRKSAANNPVEYPDERFWYATTLIRNGKYQDAISELEAYRKLKGKNSLADAMIDAQIRNCYFGLDTSNHSRGYTVTVADTFINSGTANFAANYFGSEETIIFTSGRNGNKFPKERPQDAPYLCDLYTTTKSGNTWRGAINFDKLNSEKNDGAAVMSLNENIILFTRWSGRNKEECAIYEAKKLNGIWLQPMKLNANVNVEGYQSMQPELNQNGTKLYFVSNRPGGYGKMDIWECPIDESGNPGKPVNLGPVINTPENEASPFYHDASATLYFSSEGHVGLGGLDIYGSYASDEDTLWLPPFNLGAPVNSSKEDLYYVIRPDESAGFFSSDRDACTSCADEYCFKVYSYDKASVKFFVKGTVYDKDTKEVIANALVTVKDMDDNLPPLYLITDENGFYSALIRENVDYFLKTQKNKYFADAGSISTKGLTQSKEFIKDFYLGKIPGGEIVIPGIEYDYDKATLRPESKKVLDELVDFLNLNNNISVEIGSHTDTRGKDEYNMKLSAERAKSCVDYLVSKGIDKTRLNAKGYGETKPLIGDDEISKMKTQAEKETAHQHNRRTAFRTTAEEAIKFKN